MRLSSRLATVFATAAGAAGVIAAGPPDIGFDRPGGVYFNISTPDAAACAIACARDQICMSWSFRVADHVGCSLKAVAPPLVADEGAVSGVADRAADFLSLVSIAPPPVAAPAEREPEPEPEPEPAPIAVAALSATWTDFHYVSFPDAAPLAHMADIAPLQAPQEEAFEPLAAPKGFSQVALAISPVTARPAVALAGPLADTGTVIERPAALSGARLIPVAAVRPPTVQRAGPLFQAVLEMPDERLAAPLALQARPALTKIAYRALYTPPPLSTAMPIVAIEPPSPMPRAAIVAAPASISRPGLGTQIVMALPGTSLAEQPSASALPASYAVLDAATASAAAPQEEELLGAP